MTYRPKVYGASKIEEASFWRNCVDRFPEIEWTARWPSVCLLATTGIDQMPSPAQAKRAWLIDFADVRRSDALFLLAPSSEKHLRGGLVEAGYALALSIPVYLIGEHDDFGSWRHYPLVSQFKGPDAIYWAVQHLFGIGQ